MLGYKMQALGFNANALMCVHVAFTYGDRGEVKESKVQGL